MVHDYTLDYHRLQVAIGAPSATAAVKMLGGSDKPFASVGNVPHGRSMLTYEAAGSGSFIVPWCSTPFTNAKMAIGSGFIHLVFAFNQATDSVTWYLNGIFNQTRTGCGVANIDAGNFSLGGRLGENTYDHGSQV